MMRHIYTILISALLLIACSKGIQPEQEAMSTITYELSTDIQMEIKSSQGSATQVNVLWYGVFHKKENGSYIYMSDMSAFVEITDPLSIKVPITLINNQQYKIAFVAQYKDPVNNAYTYSIDENGVMTLNCSSNLPFDGNQLDVFTFCDEIVATEQTQKKEITLSRPVARVNIGTSSPTLPDNLQITLQGIPASYNLFTGEYSSQVQELAYTGNTHTDNILANGVVYRKLAFFHVFCSSEVSCKIKVKYGSDEKEVNVNNVTVAPNHITNIVGNI